MTYRRKRGRTNRVRKYWLIPILAAVALTAALARPFAPAKTGDAARADAVEWTAASAEVGDGATAGSEVWADFELSAEATAEPSTSPEPMPDRTAEPTPSPESVPVPTSEPTPSPEPEPDPTAEPSPSPKPDPDDAAEPFASPEPDPDPAAEPAASSPPAPPFPPSYSSGRASGSGRGNLPLAGQFKEWEAQLCGEADRMRRAFGLPENAPLYYDPDALCDALAIYAALNGCERGFPYGLKAADAPEKRRLSEILWEMTELSVRSLEGDESWAVLARGLGAAEAAERFGLGGREAELAALTTDAMRAKVRAIREGSILSKLKTDDYRAIRARIPEGTSDVRRAALTAALSLVGKVDYAWGGKSVKIGWDGRWGQRGGEAAGLDCSGFVCWALVNAYGDSRVADEIGRSVKEQWDRSYPVKWSEARPGDLVFLNKPGEGGRNHAGILLTGGAGAKERIVHCSSSRGGAIVSGRETFQYVRRPKLYGD